MERTVEVIETVTSASDEDLMRRYAQGEVEAFNELFHRHKKSVYSFIHRFVTETDAVDDLFQNVFVRVIRCRERYRATAKFTTWLFTLTRSVCIDAMRKKKSAEIINLFPQPDGTTEDAVPEAGFIREITPRDEYYESEVQCTLDEIIHDLPPAQREILLLREKTDLTFADIGKVVGCSANTAKSRMHYALLELRRRLSERGIHP